MVPSWRFPFNGVEVDEVGSLVDSSVHPSGAVPLRSWLEERGERVRTSAFKLEDEALGETGDEDGEGKVTLTSLTGCSAV